MGTPPSFTDGNIVHDVTLTALAKPYGCRVYKSSGLSPADSTWTVISYSGAVYDTDPTSWSSGSQLALNTTGLWEIRARVTWAGNATGGRAIQVRKNAGGSVSGGTQLDLHGMQAAPAAIQTSNLLLCEVSATAGDYVELFVWQSSGGALALSLSTNQYCSLTSKYKQPN